ncbi:helix-turn-helix transcriptional regulator [Burkholderia pseudomallei]|uniref:helix-turn-helix transcriptional regulator n=1 Tax=Burkholderia pseudomallei TaxID=28450 RepID=UPI003F654A84
MTKQQMLDAVPRPSNPNHRAAPIDMTATVRQLDKALRVLRMRQLIERTNLSRATLYVLMSSDPTFPRKIKLTARSVGFLESEVDAWIASRAQLSA